MAGIKTSAPPAPANGVRRTVRADRAHPTKAEARRPPTKARAQANAVRAAMERAVEVGRRPCALGRFLDKLRLGAPPHHSIRLYSASCLTQHEREPPGHAHGNPLNYYLTLSTRHDQHKPR